MKRITHLLSCVALVIMTASPVTAQIKYGVTAGLNISQLHLSNSDYKPYVDRNRPGFFVGPTLIYDNPKARLGFDASLLYDVRCAKSEDLSNTNTVYCNSFQLPINFRYGMEIGDMVYGFAFTGPQFGLNTNSKEQKIAEGTGKATGHAMERRWAAENFGFSWNLGVGGIIENKIQVRISYNLALSKTGELRQVDLVDGSSTVLTKGKAHACQVAVTYLF